MLKGCDVTSAAGTAEAEMRAVIQAIEGDAALNDEMAFGLRADVIDRIEIDVIDRIEGLLESQDPPPGLFAVKADAERVRRRLEAVDERLFQRIRACIRTGGCTGAAFRDLVDACLGGEAADGTPRGGIGYDHLDSFINGVLLSRPLPEETRAPEPEMVLYQQTPARIIFELVERARLSADDVFYDLGSGLGHVPILVNLLSGVAARGVEFEPAYCEYARALAADLHLPRVRFIDADARVADYSDAGVFFMYTPFGGAMLREVLEVLRREALSRPIRLFTYGPCTFPVARESWLRCVDPDALDTYRLAEFTSG